MSEQVRDAEVQAGLKRVSKVLAYLLPLGCLLAGTAPFQVAVALLLWSEL